jgi:hypothetical protein
MCIFVQNPDAEPGKRNHATNAPISENRALFFFHLSACVFGGMT